MPHIDAAAAGQIVVWTIIAYAGCVLIPVSVIAMLSHRSMRRAMQRAQRVHEEFLREVECRRLARLLEIAEDIDKAPESERLRLYREAEALGFCEDDESGRAA